MVNDKKMEVLHFETEMTEVLAAYNFINSALTFQFIDFNSNYEMQLVSNCLEP